MPDIVKVEQLIVISARHTHQISYAIDTQPLLDLAVLLEAPDFTSNSLHIEESDTGQYGEWRLLQFFNFRGGGGCGIPIDLTARFLRVQVYKGMEGYPARLSIVETYTTTQEPRVYGLETLCSLP